MNLKYIDQMPITNSNFLSQLTLRLKKPPEYRLSTIVSTIELRINYCSLLDVMRYVSCERRCVLFFRCSVGNDKMLKPKTSFLKILHLPSVNMRAGVTAFSALLIVGEGTLSELGGPAAPPFHQMLWCAILPRSERSSSFVFIP